ncbi:MAG: hypothetical protein HZB55_08015 [Deltaproteobacteria bacterium]|nr:hypothetical protein [Deltaproteobacteria bacterium]
MKSPMVTQDAETFVSLGQAVALARAEGAVDPDTASDLTAALVAGVLAGCMDIRTYGRVHEALAALLEQAFAGPAREVEPQGGATVSEGAEPLGAYLEVVGHAWEKVSGDDEACAALASFVARAFDLGTARFGEGCWFRGRLRLELPALLRAARAAGLLVVSQEGTFTGPPVDGRLGDPGTPAGPFRVVLGWGERRAALDLEPLARG